MIEEQEAVIHANFGGCIVVSVQYWSGKFMGAYLRPNTEEGREKLRQISNKTVFFEENENAINGAR